MAERVELGLKMLAFLLGAISSTGCSPLPVQLPVNDLGRQHQKRASGSWLQPGGCHTSGSEPEDVRSPPTPPVPIPVTLPFKKKIFFLFLKKKKAFSL